MKRSRRSSNLSASVEHRLHSYVLTASAAGVGVLALARPMEAKIVYTPANVTLRQYSEYNLDLNHDGVADFQIQNELACTTFECIFYFAAFGLYVENKGFKGFNAIRYSSDGNSQTALALYPGAPIGPGRRFVGGQAQMVHVLWTTSNGTQNPKGHWVNVRNRYLGLKFDINGETHFGWARLSVGVQGTTIIGHLTGYAYETVPNRPIPVGLTKGPDEGASDSAVQKHEIQEPMSLARLAQGATGLFAWRREQRVN